ncbi:A disintegrin and metalloproteinase with thrombospondin motifs 12 [Mactra antiquata]
MDTPTKRNLKNELAGQIYNVDEQCNMTFGNDAALCRDNIYDQLDSVCYAMQCRQNGTNSCEGRFFPFDGTPCGDKKWCFSGQCIYSETAPPADESCLYGDDPNIDCTTQNACDVNDFLSSKVRCCRTCSQLPSTSSNIPTSSTSTIQSTTLSPPVSTTASSTISFTSTSQTTPSTSATTMTLSSTNTASPSIKTNSPLTETSFTTTNSSYSTTHSQTSATTAQLTSTKSPFTTTYSKISTSSPSITTSPSTKTNSEMPATTKQWTTMTTSTTGTPLSSVLDKELTFDLQTMISLFVTSALII